MSFLAFLSHWWAKSCSDERKQELMSELSTIGFKWSNKSNNLLWISCSLLCGMMAAAVAVAVLPVTAPVIAAAATATAVVGAVSTINNSNVTAAWDSLSLGKVDVLCNGHDSTWKTLPFSLCPKEGKLSWGLLRTRIVKTQEPPWVRTTAQNDPNSLQSVHQNILFLGVSHVQQ